MSKFSIHIPSPCGEPWQNMHPQDNGRFCDNCERTVVDFTLKSKSQIWSELKSNEKVCGRFTEEQLNTVFANPVTNSFFKAGTFSLLAAVFSPNHTQANIAPVWQQEQIQLSDSLVRFEGRVIANDTQEPLPFVKIFVNENPLRYGAVSNHLGVFVFQMPKNYLKAQKQVTFEILGYQTKNMTLTADSLNRTLTIGLNSADTIIAVGTRQPVFDANREIQQITPSLTDANSMIIRGSVRENAGIEDPIPFANVYVNQEIIWYKCQTDFDGLFELRIPSYMVNDTITIGIRALGYPASAIQVVPSELKEPINLNLTLQSGLIGDVVIVKDTPWRRFKHWWYKLWHKKSRSERRYD